MPLYSMDEEIQAEVQAHAEAFHRDKAEINLHTTEDGRIACREYLCLWVTTRKMKLSPNNKDWVEN